MLNVIDEFTRGRLAIRIGRKLNSTDVIDVLSDLFILRGVPGCVHSDNGPLRYAGLRAPSANGRALFPMCYGPEFIAKAVRACDGGSPR